MSDNTLPLMVKLPTMANLNMLKPDEMKAELARMQTEVFAMGDKVMSLTQICHRQASLIDALLDSFDGKDRAALDIQLNRLSEHRAKVLKAQAMNH